MKYKKSDLIYENSLSSKEDIKDFIMEGSGAATFPMSRMRLENLKDPQEGQKANIVFWCDKVFPDNIEISWDFYPIQDPGLAIIFFAAKGRKGEDVHDPSLKKREGIYGQYNMSDINALHISYFRRRYEDERAFSLVNLRKSHGFHLVAQGADPIPANDIAKGPYRIKVVKFGAIVEFYISYKDCELKLFTFLDDGKTYGDILHDGKIGFRQMAPLIAEYANLAVYKIEKNSRAI